LPDRIPPAAVIGRQFDQHVGQQLGIGLHQAGTDDALDQIAAGHQPPAQLHPGNCRAGHRRSPCTYASARALVASIISP
jgi:hypothetical protein